MMIYYSLFIKARFCPEILERILRVTRHRGFELSSLNMISCRNSGDKEVTILLTVYSHKKIHLLFSQLNKLMDINYIEIR